MGIYDKANFKILKICQATDMESFAIPRETR